MNELKLSIYNETNGLDYVQVGDYYIPAIELSEYDARPIGKWEWVRAMNSIMNRAEESIKLE